MDTLETLLSTGGKYFKFERPGDSITGTVVKAEVRQARDYQTERPLFWEDGNPVNQIVITLATEERDSSDPQDDGRRNVYIKAYGQHLRALREACKAAGVSSPRPGGQLTVTFAGFGKAEAGKNAPKELTFVYQNNLSTILGAEEAAAPAPEAPAGDVDDNTAVAELLKKGVPFSSITPEMIAAQKANMRQ